jgi:hypothetical protein
MRHIALLCATGAFALSSPASASVLFTLQGVGFETVGTLTGTFTTNDALDDLEAIDFTSSTNGAFLSTNYTLPGGVEFFETLPTGGFEIRLGDLTRGVRLMFSGANPLATPSAPVLLASNSFEYQQVGTRYITAGQVLASSVPSPRAVPEPSSWMLMIAGVLALGATLRRQKATVSFA